MTSFHSPPDVPWVDAPVMTWSQLDHYLRAHGHAATADALRHLKDATGRYVTDPSKQIAA